VTVFSSSSEGAIQPLEDANVTLGFQEIGQTNFTTIVTNQKTPANGTVIIPFTYNASMRTIYGAGSASLIAYVNNTLIGDTPPYQAGALIGGVNISQPLTWYPFPSSYFGAAVLENHNPDLRTSTTPSATESTSQNTHLTPEPELSYNLKHKEANDQSQTRTSSINHIRRLVVHLWSRTVCS